MSKATSGDTVRVHYTGTLSEGQEFDSSEGKDPLEFTLGESQVIPGFEKTVEGMEEGESRTTTVPPEEGYGQPREDLRIQMPRDQFPEEIDPEIGQELGLQQPDGRTVPVRVVDVAESEVTLDANHPLAGQNLTFEIELVEIVQD
ncbi:MAG: peptidylprolyl isomerase [Thermoanaerobaculia bacterium]|nr:peptidylprolyl isomerase [Thermoanaerobaculia bacterium]